MKQMSHEILVVPHLGFGKGLSKPCMGVGAMGGAGGLGNDWW